MKRCGGGQADQGEVPDDCYYMTSALRSLHSKGHIIIFFSKTKLFRVEVVVMASNSKNYYVLINVWAKIVIDLSKAFDKSIILLHSIFALFCFYFWEKLRVIKRAQLVIIFGVNFLLTIGLLSNAKTIVLYNFTILNNVATFICLSFIAKSNPIYIIFIQMVNHSLIIKKSSYSIWVSELMFLFINLSICTLMQYITVIFNFHKLYLVLSLRSAQIIF